jgi:hypothetical protein
MIDINFYFKKYNTATLNKLSYKISLRNINDLNKSQI